MPPSNIPTPEEAPAPRAPAAPDEPPAPASDPLVDALAQLSFTVQGVIADVGAAHGLTPVQTRLLGVLRGRQPAMHDLAAHLKLERSSTTGLVDRAERRGLVARFTTPEDGRAVHVALTTEGRALAAQAGAEVAERLHRLAADLTVDDRRRVVELSDAITQAARSDGPR